MPFVDAGQLVNISLGITRSLELVEVGEMMMINQVNHVCGCMTNVSND